MLRAISGQHSRVQVTQDSAPRDALPMVFALKRAATTYFGAMLVYIADASAAPVAGFASSSRHFYTVLVLPLAMAALAMPRQFHKHAYRLDRHTRRLRAWRIRLPSAPSPICPGAADGMAHTVGRPAYFAPRAGHESSASMTVIFDSLAAAGVEGEKRSAFKKASAGLFLAVPCFLLFLSSNIIIITILLRLLSVSAVLQSRGSREKVPTK